MKRSERRLLEEKLRYVAMEDIELDPEREQQMLEEVKAQFLRQDTETNTKRSGGHGIGRRVLIVSAAAVLFIVLSFGFTVLMPESVSHARGFMRTAAIWVNNTLHLGYEFEEPVVNPMQQIEEDATYDSFEAAIANIPYPLVRLNAPGFELQSITVSDTEDFTPTAILYSDGIQNCRIIIAPVAEDSLTSLVVNSSTTIPWTYGAFICWEADSTNYALTYYSGTEITIETSDIPYDDFLTLCQTLKVVN